jgi:hypothetical protein
MDTAGARSARKNEIKRPRFHAAIWNFSDTRGVTKNYFGASAGLVAGFGAAGFGAAGFAVAPEAAGAGTPD